MAHLSSAKYGNLSQASVGNAFSTSKFYGLRRGTIPSSRYWPRLNVSAVSTAPVAAVPSPEKRRVLNQMLAGAILLPVTGMALPYFKFFMPPRSEGGGEMVAARDILGNAVRASSWMTKHSAGDRSLVQGLNSDATYLIVTDALELERFGLNAVCTHLGCVVPWDASKGKFICNCHGSQYNSEGKVIKGPAPLSLALANTEVKDDSVFFSPWTDTDFRTGEKPWWIRK